MSKPLLTTFLATALLAACGSPEQNASDSAIVVENAQAASPAAPAPAETRGQAFVSAMLGSYEFALAGARMASEKAERPDVKQFAQTLTADFGKSLDALKAIAASGKLKLEPAPAPTHGTDIAILSSTRGAPLEKAFAEQQLQNLSELLGTMRAYKNGGDNPALKAWTEANQGMVNDRLLDLQTLSARMQGND